jgi:hypothetical protein
MGDNRGDLIDSRLAPSYGVGYVPYEDRVGEVHPPRAGQVQPRQVRAEVRRRNAWLACVCSKLCCPHNRP